MSLNRFGAGYRARPQASQSNEGTVMEHRNETKATEPTQSPDPFEESPNAAPEPFEEAPRAKPETPSSKPDPFEEAPKEDPDPFEE
jgi:hypothetical protein